MSEFEVDIESLISLVENRPVLWDHTLEKHKDKKLTLEAWREIGSALRENFNSLDDIQKQAVIQFIKKKWYNLRDNWNKSIKKIALHRKSGLGSKHMRRYVFDKQLHFLRKVLVKDENQTNFSSEKPLTYGDDNGADRKFNLDSSFMEITKTRPEIYPQIKRKRKSDDEEFRSSVQVHESEQENHHLCFFKAILPHVQNFDENQTIDFQMGVLNLIRNLKDLNTLNRYPLSNTAQFNTPLPVASHQNPNLDRRSRSFQVSPIPSTSKQPTNQQQSLSSSNAANKKSVCVQPSNSTVILGSPSERSEHSVAFEDLEELTIE